MKTAEEVNGWLKDLKAERRGGLVTKQMVIGNTGAMNALKWVLASSPSAEEVRVKVNELNATTNDSIGDEVTAIAYSAMIAALNWVLQDD
jgi:hypothetical protein